VKRSHILQASLAAIILLLPLGCRLNTPEAESPESINIIKPVPEDMQFNWGGPRSTVGHSGLQKNTYGSTGWDSWPDVSLDGRYLVFVCTGQSGNPDIYLKTTNGTVMSQKTTSTANDIQPSISPDGKYIAFSSDRNGNYDIYVTSAWSNGPLWQVTTTSSNEMSPSWSPDGTKITYCAQTHNGDWELWIYDISTQAKTNLGPGMNPKWHPSNNIIAFQRPYRRNKASYSIYTIDSEGRNLSLVVRGERWAATQPNWSPDGKRLVFAASTQYHPWQKVEPLTTAGDIYVVNIDGSQEMRITENSGSNWTPTWGVQDGIERIFFVSNRDDKTNIWSVRAVKFSLTPSK